MQRSASSFRSLGFRLPLAFLLVSAVSQIALWVSVLLVLTVHLQDRLDTDLLIEARRVMEAIDRRQREEPNHPIHDIVQQVVKAYEKTNFYLLVHLAEVKRTVTSSNMIGARFPYVRGGSGFSYGPRFETLRQKQFLDLTRGSGMRLVTLEQEGFNGYLQMAADTTQLERLRTDVQWLLLIFTSATLVLSGLTAWIVSQRLVRPLAAVARAAGEISLTRDVQPLAVPPTGDEIADVATAFNLMIERLQAEFSNQQSFISNVAHELKTPLAVLFAAVQNERRASASPLSAEFLDSAEEELRRLLRTVETFLLLSRARAGREPNVITPVALEEVVFEAVAHCRRQAEQRGVALVPSLNADANSPQPVVRGDGDLLTTAVENLITNAIRHSPVGGTVEVDVYATFKQAQVVVRDRGPGIPAAHLPRIFEPFYQVSPQTKLAGKAGIGLAIVQAVATLHGGNAVAAQREGGGAEFTILLPQAPASI